MTILGCRLMDLEPVFLFTEKKVKYGKSTYFSAVCWSTTGHAKTSPPPTSVSILYINRCGYDALLQSSSYLASVPLYAAAPVHGTVSFVALLTGTHCTLWILAKLLYRSNCACSGHSNLYLSWILCKICGLSSRPMKNVLSLPSIFAHSVPHVLESSASRECKHKCIRN